MNYYINQSCFMSAFPIPAAVVDSHLKLAKGEHIKVLLYIMRKMSTEIEIEEVAENCGLTVYETEEALLYWADAGILLPKEQPFGAKPKAENPPKAEKKTLLKASKPTRQDVARRGVEDAKIRYLLNEAQAKLGRNLKTNETTTLVWLYDDEGLDVSLILMIVQYAVAHGKANIRFIESTAIDWVNKGIDSIFLADEELNKMALSEQAWGIVCRNFGLEKRKPSKKESELAYKWIEEWKFSEEMLSAAYDACVNAKSKFSFAYVAKILENWHNNGYKSPDDIEEKPKKEQKDGFGAYDLDLFEKMLDSKE